MKVEITVPMEPVSVNGYTRHTRSGRHYKTPEAKVFEEIGAIACRGKSVQSSSYAVTIHVYQGAGKKADLDNLAKVTIDLLANNGVLLDKNGNRSTDAHIIELHMTKQRDRENPRTEIIVEGF